MKRNYELLCKTFESFKGNRPEIAIYRENIVAGYPFYHIHIETRKENPTCLIGAGIHGDEPAGIYALCDFFPRIIELQSLWNFLIFPCINPVGYAKGTRMFNRQDINRGFWYDGLYDINKFMMKIIPSYKPSLSIDLHEDKDSLNFAVFETYTNDSYIFKFPEMKKLVRIEKDKMLDTQLCKNGIIHSRREEATLENYTYRCGAKLSITVELPGKQSPFDRITIGSFFLNLLFKKLEVISFK